MTANYLLRILVAAGAVEVLVNADNDEVALSLALEFVGYKEEAEVCFELYDIQKEVAPCLLKLYSSSSYSDSLE